MPISLTILVITSVGTAAAVIANYHPAWDALIEYLIPHEDRPYAHKHIRQAFLLLSAWLSAIWLHLMLGYTGLSLPDQGTCLVSFACIWFLLGRLLAHLPDVVEWPVFSAGWLMWLIGLLEVFFTPTEALIALVLGLALSVEALRRSQQLLWLPFVLLQIILTALEAAQLLTLPLHLVMLVVAISLGGVGMFGESYARRGGRLTAAMGAVLAVGIWWLHPDGAAALGLTSLAILAVLAYRDWRWLWAVYLSVFILIAQSRVQPPWPAWLIAGVAQWLIGAELSKALRPRRSRTLRSAIGYETDWATPFLWIGTLCSGLALIQAIQEPGHEIIPVCFALAVLMTLYAIRLRWFHLPYVPLFLAGLGLSHIVAWILIQPLVTIGNSLLVFSLGLVMVALFMRWLCLFVILMPEHLARIRWFAPWIRPLLVATLVLTGTSVLFVLVCGTVYRVDPFIKVVNSLLIAVFVSSVYVSDRRLIWLWAALGMATASWLFLLRALGITYNSAWITFPLGLALLILGKIIDHPRRKVLDYAGSLVWVVGSLWNLDRAHLTAAALFILALHLTSLVGYGSLLRQRTPLTSGILLIIGGILYSIARINVWLIPLMGGLVLVVATLLLEVQHESTERWLSRCFAYWRRLE